MKINTPITIGFVRNRTSDSAQLMRGVRYLGSFLLVCGFWLLLPLAGLLWARRRSWIVIFGGLTFALTASVVALGGDGLPMFRFIVPILPPFFLLLAEGATGTVERFSPRPSLRGALVVAAIIMAALSGRALFFGPAHDYVRQDVAEVAAWKAIGVWFRGNVPPDASIAVIPAGAIPYFSGLRTIDMLGLNDATIAHRAIPGLGSGQPGHEKYDVEYVLEREPTYILVGVYALAPRPESPSALVRPHYGAEQEMLRAPRLWRDYRLERARAEGGYFAYFVRTAASSDPPAGAGSSPINRSSNGTMLAARRRCPTPFGCSPSGRFIDGLPPTPSRKAAASSTSRSRATRG